MGKEINRSKLNSEYKSKPVSYLMVNEGCTCHMCGCRPIENAQKISLGSWIKPLGFDLCQCGLWDSFANEIDPQKML
jgi:hypothetical protein